MVVKKDKSREAFNRQKLLNGMMRACEKRPVSYQMLEDAVDNIEQARSIPTSGRSRPFMWANLPCRS